MGSYLGEPPIPSLRGLALKDTFTGDGSTTTFDLNTAIPNFTERDIAVFVDNIRQEPGSGKSYTLGFDGSSSFKRITFTAAPDSGAVIYVLYGTETTQLLALSDSAVVTAKLADNAVTTAKITDANVTAAKLASNAVTTAKITDANVTTAKIAGDAITGAKIADDAVDSEHLVDGSVDNAHLAGSIANGKLANSSITINGSAISLGGSVSTGIQWQAVKTSDFNAAVGEGYFINTTGGAITATLPGSASIGNEIHFIDYAGTADSNNITINRNSHNIQGAGSNLTVATERAAFALVYVDATQGWLLKDK